MNLGDRIKMLEGTTSMLQLILIEEIISVRRYVLDNARTFIEDKGAGTKK